jgi:hypothetical protein
LLRKPVCHANLFAAIFFDAANSNRPKGANKASAQMRRGIKPDFGNKISLFLYHIFW